MAGRLLFPTLQKLTRNDRSFSIPTSRPGCAQLRVRLRQHPWPWRLLYLYVRQKVLFAAQIATISPREESVELRIKLITKLMKISLNMEQSGVHFQQKE